jgi:hypothetical protein
MRRALAAALLGAVLACAHLAATPSPARAADPVKCAPDNQWCVGAFLRKGHRFLDIFGFDFKGRYKVCVTPPRAKERCKTFKLVRNASGANASSVRFTSHFPHARRGTYAARWIYDGKQVGSVLRFKHPA